MKALKTCEGREWPRFARELNRARREREREREREGFVSYRRYSLVREIRRTASTEFRRRVTRRRIVNTMIQLARARRGVVPVTIFPE